MADLLLPEADLQKKWLSRDRGRDNRVGPSEVGNRPKALGDQAVRSRPKNYKDPLGHYGGKDRWPCIALSLRLIVREGRLPITQILFT